MKKYNKSDIMKKAWEIRKASNSTMSTALRASWAIAKAEAAAEQYGKDCGWNYKVIVNRWSKGGHDRTYIATRLYTNAWNRKKDESFGWVNNLTGEYHAA